MGSRTTTAVVDMSWLMYLERVTRIELALQLGNLNE